ncbi:MAG TPA: hypothetical protein VIL11_02735 [Limnochordales bacterium]
MEERLCVIVAADELGRAAPPDGGPPAGLPQALAELARFGCQVWWAGPEPPGLSPLVEDPALRPWVQQGRLRQAPSLDEAARACRAGGREVLVVGGRPSGSIRWANRHRFTSALVAVLEGGDEELPADVEEIPDFVVGSVDELPALVFRMEREQGDFEGTE